jgi:hypothetical protein
MKNSYSLELTQGYFLSEGLGLSEVAAFLSTPCPASSNGFHS